jgi:hypothetical protein
MSVQRRRANLAQWTHPTIFARHRRREPFFLPSPPLPLRPAETRKYHKIAGLFILVVDEKKYKARERYESKCQLELDPEEFTALKL